MIPISIHALEREREWMTGLRKGLEVVGGIDMVTNPSNVQELVVYFAGNKMEVNEGLCVIPDHG